MACGLKHYETRGWATSYRGELAICSARRKIDDVGLEILRDYPQIDPVIYGCVLCVVELFDCVRSELFDEGQFGLSAEERSLGNYDPNRFVWMTRLTLKVPAPFPVVGRQGLFALPPDVEAAVRTALKGL